MADAAASASLLDCLRSDADAQAIERLAGLSHPQWESVLALAQRQGVAALLGWKLDPKTSPVPVPAELQASLKKAWLVSAYRNTLLDHELGKALHALSAAAIPVILLKGAHLAELVYPDISLRPMADIDLLVRLEDAGRCDQVLCEIGYGPSRRPWIERDFSGVHHHLPPYCKAEAPPIEIHWSIVDPHIPVDIPLAELWQRARPVEVASAPALVLAPEHLLMHLCLHGCYYDRFYRGLRLLADVFSTVQKYHQEIDWQLLQTLALQWGLRKPVFLTLYLTHELFHASFPESLLPSLQPGDFNPQIAAQAREKLFSDKEKDLSMNFTFLWGAGGLGSKVRRLWQSTFPSPMSMSFKYAIPPNSLRLYLCYFDRLSELLKRYSRAAWDILRSSREETAVVARENLLVEWLSMR